MSKLQKVLQSLEGNERVRSNVEKARELFEQKPYAVEYLKLHEKVSKWGFIPSLLSIAGASLFFLTLFPNSSLWLVLPIGAILATVYELAKASASFVGFKAYFSGKRWGIALVIPAYIISVCLSTWGAYNGYQLLEDESARTAELQQISNIEESNAEYENLISSLEDDISNFEKQHTINVGADKGKISWGVRGQHAELKTQLAELRAKRLAVKEEKTGELSSIMENARNEVGGYLYAALGLSLLVEVIIFLIARFQIYYYYKSHTEVELIQHGELYQIPLNTLRQLATLVQGSEQAHQSFPISERTPPGFTQKGRINPPQDRNDKNGTESRINTPINTDINPPQTISEIIGFLAKYRAAVNDLENGLSIRKTAIKHSISKSTVQNIKRCINTLHQSQI